MREEEWRKRWEECPVVRLLELELRSRSDRGAVVAMRPQPAHEQEYGVVQGGILCAFADQTAAVTLYPSLGENENMAGIDCKMSFLQPALASGAELVARSTVLRRGRSVGVVEVEVAQDGALVAKGTFTFLFRTRR